MNKDIRWHRDGSGGYRFAISDNACRWLMGVVQRCDPALLTSHSTLRWEVKVTIFEVAYLGVVEVSRRRVATNKRDAQAQAIALLPLLREAVEKVGELHTPDMGEGNPE